MSGMAGPVLIVGDANVDLLVHLPAGGGGPRQAPEPVLTLGGTGANTAVALRRLGVEAALLGTIGDDGYGRYARQRLTELGVGVAELYAHPALFTTLVLAIVDAQGERTLLGWPRRGAAQTGLLPEQVDPVVIAGASWLHTTGICLVESPGRDAVLQALRLARAAGVPVSLDLNLRLGLEGGKLPDEFAAILRTAIGLADVVFGSAADEWPLLCPGATPEEAALGLAEGRRTIVTRLGSAGVLAAAEGAVVTVPAWPVRVVSTVGAGDAFNAGYIAAALAGEGLAERLRWGNAVAALTISSGPGEALLSRERVAALLAERPAPQWGGAPARATPSRAW